MHMKFSLVNIFIEYLVGCWPADSSVVLNTTKNSPPETCLLAVPPVAAVACRNTD